MVSGRLNRPKVYKLRRLSLPAEKVTSSTCRCQTVSLQGWRCAEPSATILWHVKRYGIAVGQGHVREVLPAAPIGSPAAVACQDTPRSAESRLQFERAESAHHLLDEGAASKCEVHAVDLGCDLHNLVQVVRPRVDRLRRPDPFPAGEPEGLHHVAELGNERRIVYFLHVMRPLLIRYRENAFQTLSERRIQDGP
jgi:hypothetical protein